VIAKRHFITPFLALFRPAELLFARRAVYPVLPSLNPVTVMPMEHSEQIMASRTLPQIRSYESTAQVWIEILQSLKHEPVPRSPLVRWTRWLRLHWKPVLLTIGFWVAYALGYALWLVR
jgi:hypothetical protein